MLIKIKLYYSNYKYNTKNENLNYLTSCIIATKAHPRYEIIQVLKGLFETWSYYLIISA